MLVFCLLRNQQYKNAIAINVGTNFPPFFLIP